MTPIGVSTKSEDQVSEVADVGNAVLAEYNAAIGRGTDIPPEAIKQYAELKIGIGQIDQATEKYHTTWVENRNEHTRGGIDSNTYHERRHAIKSEAATARLSGSGNARRAFAELKTVLEDSVIPKLDPKNELQARQLLDLALGDGDAAKIGSRALRISAGSDDELKAALMSKYGQLKLKSAGVHARTIEDVRARVVATSPHKNAKLASGVGRLINAIVAAELEYDFAARNR
jgi:hypothetical protein